ncbi:MAG: hypothetical protein QM784_35090 [Polyangiaceae bacterium]
MTIRSTCRKFSAFLVLLAVACGGSGPAASDASKTSTTERTDPTSSDDTNPLNSTNDDAPASSSSTAEPGPQSASSEKSPSIPEGLQLLDRRSLSLDFALNLAKKGEGKGVNSGTWSFAEERTMRVKSAQKDVITEMQVVYGKWEAKPLLGLTYQVPTDGKTYLLASKGGDVTLTRGANEKVSSEEQHAVKAEYGWVGSRNPLRQALLDAKLQTGTELPKSKEISRLLLGAIPGVDSDAVETTASLEKVEGGNRKKAVLKVNAKLRIVSNKTVFDLRLERDRQRRRTHGLGLGSRPRGHGQCLRKPQASQTRRNGSVGKEQGHAVAFVRIPLRRRRTPSSLATSWVFFGRAHPRLSFADGEHQLAAAERRSSLRPARSPTTSARTRVADKVDRSSRGAVRHNDEPPPCSSPIRARTAADRRP